MPFLNNIFKDHLISGIKKIMPSSRYQNFKNSLPDNLRNTPERDYRMKLLWRNNGMPTNFEESIETENPLFRLEEDNQYHAFSVEPNSGKFLKPKNHPSLQMELDWYNSDNVDAKAFRDLYDLRKRGRFYRYLPKN